MTSPAQAMNFRLRALIRKAGALEDPAVDGFLAVALKHMRTKRHYEDVLGSREGAEKFAKTHAMTAAQTELLLRCVEAKDIVTPQPVLDWLLTAVFLAQIVLVFYAFAKRGMLHWGLGGLAVTAVAVWVTQVVWARLGTWLSRAVVRAGLVDNEPLAGKIQMKKWQDSSWQLVVHVAASALELYILSDEPWFERPETAWVPHIYGQTFRWDLEVVYVAQLLIWIYTCILHRFFDERKKDYYVLYLHHVVTIALVGCSWGSGYLRIGLLVLLVHDVSDIFVDTLKMVNFLKLEGPRGYFASEIAYVTCVLSWVYWRLYQYPFRIMSASYIDAFHLLFKLPRSDSWWEELSPANLPLFAEANALLFCLLALHVYWFHLFIMIGYRILTESAREASRQEYEGDSDDE